MEKGKIAFSALFALLVSAVLLSGCIEPEGKEIPRFGSYEELAATFKESQSSYRGYGIMEKMTTMGAVAPTAAGAESAADSGAAVGYSRTNVQVEGVDEADIVKSDGKYIYNFSRSQDYSKSNLIITDAYPIETSQIISKTELESVQPQEMFVLGDKLLLFGYKYVQVQPKVYAENGGITAESMIRCMDCPYYGSSRTVAQLYDISDRAAPNLEKEIEFEGSYLTSRLIGSNAYFVVNTWPTYYIMTAEGESEESGNIIPLMVEDGVEKRIAEPTEIGYIPPMPAESFVTIASLNLDTKELQKETIVGSAQTVYASLENIYLAAIAWLPVEPAESQEKCEAGMENCVIPYVENTEKTVINKFALADGEVKYVGQGFVPGHVLNQFSMDEFDGKFRIATTVWNYGGVLRTFATAVGGAGTVVEQAQAVEVPLGSDGATDDNADIVEAVPPAGIGSDALVPPAPEVPEIVNNIYVLDEEMSTIGALEDLAPGEQIYSARFMGERAYLVTFKKIDPLFVIDLSDAENPKVLGKLKIPGYSDYLHPIDDTHIIGVGKEAVESTYGDFAWYQGMKVAVFDVSDVENPVEMHKITIGDRGTDSYALHDHKAFLYDKEKELLVLPITLAEISEEQKNNPPEWGPAYGEYVFQGAFVYRLTLENGFEERGRITHVSAEDELKRGYYFSDEYSVKRALYIDNVLYTLSGRLLKANDLSSLAELKVFDFSEQEQPQVGLANPASVYCEEQGGKSVNADCKNVGTENEGWYNHLTDELMDLKVCGVPEGSQIGYCVFSDGSKCEEWEFYRSGECVPFGTVPTAVVCTEEAKVCPDGSSVGRNPDLNCEFDPCPAEEITVNQAGGMQALILECSDKNYVSETADYIVEGTVGEVESKWNEAQTQIHTYSSILVESYTKGDLDAKNILIVTPGGTVGDITESVEDQPTLHEGKSVRIYFQILAMSNGEDEYAIVCGTGGVEEIQ